MKDRTPGDHARTGAGPARMNGVGPTCIALVFTAAPAGRRETRRFIQPVVQERGPPPGKPDSRLYPHSKCELICTGGAMACTIAASPEWNISRNFGMAAFNPYSDENGSRER